MERHADRTKSLTVVIADDHPLVRNGLKDVVSSINGIETIAEACNGIEAIALAKKYQPVLLTLDISMPMVRGMEVFVETKRWSPQTRVAVVTGFTAAGQLAEWDQSGVDGLFLKTCPPAELVKGFCAILAGEQFRSEAVVCALGDAAHRPDLTPRERQVLHLIAAGSTNADIATRLSISIKTVDNHRTHMMAKLELHSVNQLLAYALKEGLLDAGTQL